jgi:hypothetical protein
MTDLFDTRQIPDHASYWDALTDRVAAHAVRSPNSAVVDWFAHSRVGWIAASLLLVAGLAFMTMPTDDPLATSLAPDWTQPVAPSDGLGRAVISSNTPPAIGALLLLGSAGVMK